MDLFNFFDFNALDILMFVDDRYDNLRDQVRYLEKVLECIDNLKESLFTQIKNHCDDPELNLTMLLMYECELEIERILEEKRQKLPTESESSSKIKWQGNEHDLTFLWDELIRKNLVVIDESRKWVILADHFVNREGNPFKPKQLSSAAQRTNLDSSRIIPIIHELTDKSSD